MVRNRSRPARSRARIGRRVAGFLRDSRGNFGMMVAIAVVPLVLSIGGGVDVANVWRSKAEAQAAADSAVIVAAKYVGTDASERERLADMYMQANIGDDIDADLSGTNLTKANGRYTYALEFSVETPFLSLMRVTSLDVSVEAVSARANIPLDIVLVLDSSGSMQNDSRMSELKSAVKLFLDQFAGTEIGDAKVQAALIPFDTQVRLDSATMGTYAGNAANPYATTNCATIADATDRAACTAAQAVQDPAVDCSALNWNASSFDRSKCGPQTDGFKLGTARNWEDCGRWSCSTYYYTAYKSGSSYLIDRYYTYLSCEWVWVSSRWGGSWDRVCRDLPYGSATRIYSATITTPATTPLTTKNNATETANNDLILTQSETWSGCVIDRTQPYDVQNDAPLSAIAATLYPKANCGVGTLLAVQPLTTDLATLKTKVDSMQPSGNTNITIGVQWGMEAFTPTYPLAGANTDARAQKVMIVLTDGNNTQNRWSGGSQASLIDARTTLACSNAKLMKVELYTIRLINGNEALLKGCATDANHYFSVTSASQLTETFREIAERVLRIRIVS